MAQQWFYKVMGQQFGPVSSAELQNLVQHGMIALDTLVTNSPEGNWVLAENVKGLFSASQETPKQISDAVSDLPPSSPPINYPSRSSKVLIDRTSYVVNNLMQGEKILYAATIHPMIFLPSCIPFFLMIIGIVLAMIVSDITAIFLGVESYCFPYLP